MRRNTQEALIAMKKEILNSCINKKIKCIEGAKLLHMHPKSFLRLKKRYIEEGEAVLVSKPPGPKIGFIAINRTQEWLEKIICELALKYFDSGPIELSQKILDQYQIKINQSTVFRILKRNKIRYFRSYIPITRHKPQLYCLETPGIELQLDACYPFGRGRQLACFDAIDDCSRHVSAKIYPRETAENAIHFIKYLIKHVPFTIKRIRIDNRSKNKITEFCKSIGIEVIVNQANTPKQNGKIERFHRTIKEHFFWKYCGFYDDLEFIDYRLQQWLVFYNEQRHHGGYGMNRLTPIQKIVSSWFNSLNIIPKQKVTLTMQQYIN
jgi:transposase-like protein